MRSKGEFHRLGEWLSHAAITSITDWPQAVCDSYLGCAFITSAPPDPLCTAALPLLYYFFLPDCKATLLMAHPSLPTFSCNRHTGSFHSQRLSQAVPFLSCSSRNSSLRAFWLQLQPATSSSSKSTQALVQIPRMVFRLCLKLPAGQSCETVVCPRVGGCPWKWHTQGWHKDAFCCQSWSKQCIKFLLRWLLAEAKMLCF